jgi:hypothetical protein
MNKKSIIFSVIVVTLLLMGTVFFRNGVNMKSQQEGATKVAAKSNSITYSDRPKYTNMKDLLQASDLVFQGTVEGVYSKRNLARNPQNPSEEDPNIYVEGIDYNVKVNEILKGQADSNVLVTEQKQMQLGKDQSMVQDEHYLGLDSGHTYIFFVKKSNTTGRYYSVGDPFFFEIENNKAMLKTTEKGLLNNFKVEDVNLFKKEIKERN